MASRSMLELVGSASAPDPHATAPGRLPPLLAKPLLFLVAELELGSPLALDCTTGAPARGHSMPVPS